MRHHRPLCLLAASLASAVGASSASAQENAGRNAWQLGLTLDFVSLSSPLDAWTEGGLGKLRFEERNAGTRAAHGYAQYRGRLAETLWAHVVFDYAGDASKGLDLSEAFLTWRPVPHSRSQHQLRFGSFYPPLSLENGGPGWTSPYTLSYSAINTWLGEEIRPFGAEWSMHRHLGALGSPHQLGVFTGSFYGDDPAGTLLFWRGWSLHDRQTRFNDTLEIPPLPVWDTTGTIIDYIPQSLRPIRELDHRPGFYAGVEWRYARRFMAQLSHYDNGADPHAYGSREWGWHTRFDHLAAQISLPRDIGLIAQWMRGRTAWVVGAEPSGVLRPSAKLVHDGFDAKFLLVTKRLARGHRLTLRYDRFAIERDEPAPALVADNGHAWTLAYRYEPVARSLSIGAEWLEISSERDLWSAFYGLPHNAEERQFRLGLSLGLDTRERR